MLIISIADVRRYFVPIFVENGDTVLIDISGMYEWAMIMIQPRRLITDDGAFLMDDLLEDIAVVGVVTHEVTTLNTDYEAPF